MKSIRSLNKQTLDETVFPSSGIVLIDKPSGITSHDVVDQVRRATGVKRIGHAGTLDPLATGLLIILISREFTKQQSKFLKQDKQYLVTGRLGIVTDSYDIDGQVLKEANKQEVEKITKEDIETALQSFKGEITQTVPAYSAVKVKGKKLYELARKDKINLKKLPQRQVTIQSIKLMKINKEKGEFTLQIDCSSGTYIRSLVHDLGEKLGTGATVVQLRRTKIGKMKVEDGVRLKN